VAIGLIAIFLVAYVPLIVNEATTGFSETRAALDYLAAGRSAGEAAIPVRFTIVGLRVVSWPLTGLITDGLVPAVVAVAGVVAATLWLDRAGRPERTFARWLGLGLLWTVAFLTVAAPSLASVILGLPNDHYHAFADPMVFVLVGLGLGTLLAARPVGALVAGMALVALLGWNVHHLPPAVARDGGYPAAQAAAERVEAALTGAGLEPGAAVQIRSLPAFKSTEAIAYPLAVLGRPFVAALPDDGIALGSALGLPPTQLRALVLLCDDLFRDANGAPCNGPAENAFAPDAGGEWGPLLVRFEAAPGRFVSVYGPA
jgi:hypothetical protein